MAIEKKNIFLNQTMESMPYISSPRPIGNNYPKRSAASHAAIIERKLRDCSCTGSMVLCSNTE